MKKYNSFLGAFFSGDNGQGGYNAAYGKSALAKLYTSQDPAEQQMAAEGLARVDPETAGKWQQEQAKVAQQNLERKARMLASAPSLEVKQQLYSSIAPEVRKVWADAPDVYTPELDQMLTSWAGADGGKPKARSSHILADGTIAFMDEYGNLTKTGEKASNTYGFQTDAEGNVYAQDKRGGTVAPAPMGSVQPSMPQVQAGADPMAGGLDRINQGVQVLKANGVPVDKINAWADSEFAKLQGTVQQGVVEQAPAQAQASQAKVAVKGDELTPYQAESLDIKREAAERARVASEAALAAKKRADEAADNDRKGRVAAAQQTTNNLLTNIRELKKHPGFPQLGTVGGNAADQMLPEFMPTEYRGAKGRLETIKGQIALQAMASLKALSSSGATGFGALAVPELNLLQNSIQTLTTSQNNSDILAAINQIETLLTKAGQAGQDKPASSGKQVGRFVIEEN